MQAITFMVPELGEMIELGYSQYSIQSDKAFLWDQGALRFFVMIVHISNVLERR